MIVHLIGGGLSAKDLDTSQLLGHRVGVNDAAFHKPCDSFFSNDHGYALIIRDKIEGFLGHRHLSIRHRHMHLFDGWNAVIWQRMNERDPVMKGRALSSGRSGTPGCSGYVALNLAVRLGAKTIILFGYDFQPDYRYFFSEQPYPRVEMAGVIASFREVAPWYRSRGIRIFNANPASAIDAFPRISHAEAFEEDRRHHGDDAESAGPEFAAMA